jgi:cell surface protein SprA
MKPTGQGRSLFNELRIADMDNQGMAAILSVDSNLADFATILLQEESTIGFGALEQDQTKEAVKIFNNIIS